MPYVPEWADPVWHLFVVRNSQRDKLQQRLGELGIGTMIHYSTPPHLQGAYAELGFSKGSFPVAEKIHDEVLSLPIGPHLTIDSVNSVVAAFA